MAHVEPAVQAKPQRNQPRRSPNNALANEALRQSPRPTELSELLTLQRLAGNAAVARVLQRQVAVQSDPEDATSTTPDTGSTLLGGLGNVGKLLAEAGVVGSGPATTRPLATASGSVGGGPGPNLREAPAEPGTSGGGAVSGGPFGLGNIPKMLEGAGVLGGPKLPGPDTAAGPGRKGNIGEQMSFKSGGGSGLGNIPKMLEGAGVLGGPKLPGPDTPAGPGRKGNIGEQMSFKSGTADARAVAVSASADRFIRDAIALGVPGVADLVVRIRAVLAGQA